MEVNVNAKCPHCQKDLVVTAGLDPVQLAPKVRGNIHPVSSVMIYKITSADIKSFLIDKARKYVPGVKMEVVPRYCERKKQRSNEPHGSYASLRIAFSDSVIEKNGDLGWYAKIGEGDGIRVVKSLFDGFIRKFQYNRKDIDEWMKNYKNLEELEDSLGITEAYLNDLRTFATPKAIKAVNGDTWVAFAAAPENVIKDMLTIDGENVPAGRICIQDVTQISKDTVEFLVYVYPEDFTRENTNVRKILLGEEKAKKN